MLRVTVEIVPFGVEDGRRELGRLEVWHAAGNETEGVYSYRLQRDDQVEVKGGKIKHHRADGWLPLIASVFERLRGLLPPYRTAPQALAEDATATAKVTFDLGDPHATYRLCEMLQASSMRNVLWHLEQELRRVVKYEEDKEAKRHARRWQRHLHELLDAEGIDLYAE